MTAINNMRLLQLDTHRKGIISLLQCDSCLIDAEVDNAMD